MATTTQLAQEATTEGDTLVALEPFDQCGGTGGNCRDFSNTQCVDAVYSEVPCPAGHECTRVNDRWGAWAGAHLGLSGAQFSVLA